MSHRKWIEYRSSRDRLSGRVTSQNKTITMHRNYRSFESQLRKTTTPGRNLRQSFQYSHTAQHFRRSDVKTYSRARTQRARGTRQHVDPSIYNLRSPQTTNRSEHHPTFDLRRVDTREIHCRSLSPVSIVNRFVFG